MSVSLITRDQITQLAGGADRQEPDAASGLRFARWDVAPPLSLLRTYQEGENGIVTLGWRACRITGMDERQKPIYEISDKPLIEGRFRPYAAPAWAAAQIKDAAPVPEGSYRFIGATVDLTREGGTLVDFHDFKLHYDHVMDRLRDMHAMTKPLSEGPYSIPSVALALDPARMDGHEDSQIRENVRAAQSVMRGYLERYFPLSWIKDATEAKEVRAPADTMLELPPRPATSPAHEDGVVVDLSMRRGAQ